jgi:KDO2-lipid IV(A) lauroyltransferase
MKREKMSKSKVIENISFIGSEILQKYQKENKNFILITGHYGNWELLSQAIAIKFDFTLVGVGRKLDSPIMDRVLSENRERFNVEMIEKKGAMKSAIRVIKQNKTLGILTDQSIGAGQSVDVTFFDKKTTHTPLASILSRKFGLDLIPAYISTKDYKNYVVEIYPPIESIKTDNQEEDLRKLTQAQALVIEKQIKKYPNQWFWMHKRWKEYFGEIYK